MLIPVEAGSLSDLPSGQWSFRYGIPKAGEWYLSHGVWQEALSGLIAEYLIARRIVE